MFRKALAHRDSRHELLFTGILLLMSRISWLILYRTPSVWSSEHGPSDLGRGAVSLFFRFWYISENLGPKGCVSFAAILAWQKSDFSTPVT